MTDFNEEQLCVELEKIMKPGKSADGVYILEDLDPNTIVNERGTTLLHLSVKYDKLFMMNYLVQSKCNLDAQDEYGDTPLILALYNYRIDHARLLLKVNANIFITNNAGESAFQIIFGKKGFDFSRLMGIFTKRINESNICDETLAELLSKCNCPTYYAVEFGKPAVLRMLLENDFEVNSFESRSGETALHKAADSHNLEMVEILLEYGANVNLINQAGFTPFAKSIKYKSNIDIEIMKLLMPDKIEWADRCPIQVGKLKLYWLFVTGSKIGLQLFLQKYSVDPNVRDVEGNTLLHYIVKNENAGVIELVRNKGFDINAVNNNRESVLHVAIKNSAPIVVLQFLLENGADANFKGPYGNTALHAACMIPTEQAREIIPLLLKFGADVNMSNKVHGSFLCYLITTGKIEYFEIFQNAKFDVNALDRCDQTALHTAAIRGHFDIVKWLLHRGAIVNQICSDGDTPLLNVFGGNILVNSLFKKIVNESDKLKCVAILLIYGAQLISRFVSSDIRKVEFTVVDVATLNGTLSLITPILSHLAILVELNQPVYEKILDQINENDQLRTQFVGYKGWLKNAKTEMIYRNISLFRILTESTEKITNYAKPDMIFKKALDKHGANLDVYFKMVLDHGYCKVKEITELRAEASYIVSESIELFDPSHIAVRKIISFLNFEDLKMFA